MLFLNLPIHPELYYLKVDHILANKQVQFDQFVAQGKVLHNYANILELLLRLRQCCNHPFLVMRSEQWDIQKLIIQLKQKCGLYIYHLPHNNVHMNHPQPWWYTRICGLEQASKKIPPEKSWLRHSSSPFSSLRWGSSQGPSKWWKCRVPHLPRISRWPCVNTMCT